MGLAHRPPVVAIWSMATGFGDPDLGLTHSQSKPRMGAGDEDERESEDKRGNDSTCSKFFCSAIES